MEKENQKELSKILGLGRGVTGLGEASWAEIYTEIGRLKERAEKPAEIRYFTSTNSMPLNNAIPFGDAGPKCQRCGSVINGMHSC